MNPIFAAITQAPPSPNPAPATPPGPGAPPVEVDPFPGMEKKLPPTDVPWPDWAWWIVGIAAVIVLGLLLWLVVWWFRRRVAAVPPTPRAIALQALEALRANVHTLDAYAFAVSVSDVLRTFISAQFSLHATSQTSPEFLAEISNAARFSEADRALLATFLEQCDLRKFARVEASDNEALLGSASAFVESASQ